MFQLIHLKYSHSIVHYSQERNKQAMEIYNNEKTNFFQLLWITNIKIKLYENTFSEHSKNPSSLSF